MADILKVTTPLVPSNQLVHSPKPAQESGAIFNIQDITRVQKTNPQGEPMQQNNTLLDQNEMPTILMNLLKDPSVTVTFLRNIFMLQDIVGLLSANNQTVTQELENLFAALLMKPDEMVSEMMGQGQDSTRFHGKLFDVLRQILEKNPNQPAIRGETVNLLKSLTSLLGQRDILNSVANDLRFLADSTASSKTLSGKLAELVKQLENADARNNFGDLKKQVLALLKEVEGSILYTPKLQKIVSITAYNLSRFNDNSEFLQESITRLMEHLPDGAQKQSFIDSIADFIANLSRSAHQAGAGEFLDFSKFLDKQSFADNIRNLIAKFDNNAGDTQSSRVMDVLIKILEAQSKDETITLLTSGKLEKILQSLLSSPCNFTPLLHFIVPVEYEDMKSFAEMWIDPNSEEEKEGSNAEKRIHMLIVFDIGTIGRFEAEFYVKGDTIDLSLLCPTAYAEHFMGLGSQFARSISGLRYRFGNISIGKLERPRSLIEVFTSLPNRRVGVDVKV